ncbi:MAG: hypothetical protein JWO43_657 [Candidatus Adlerbacteria bacterium]|nr:hypothetical protein [Candidatus Adlerbacteria bacterium]
MHQAAYLLAFFALGSQFLALIRDRLLAASFGAGHTLDVYYAAFRIPDFLFATVASLLSLYAMLPVLSKIENAHPGQTISFLRGALLFFFVAMGIVAGVIFVLAPVIVPLVAPGISSDELVTLVRILLLQPILLGASNIVAALTQLRHRFVLYSISPLLYNLGIIFGIVVLYPHIGVTGLGWGVVIGALLHFGIQAPFFAAEKSDIGISFKQLRTSLWEVLKLSVPRTLALGAGQISLLALVAIASFFEPGSIAVFMFAYNLQAVPLTIIGVSYSVAAFPTLARLHASGQKEDFAKHIETALRHIVLWSILATVFVIVMRAQLVRVILGSGAFDWTATRLTAAALALFILSLVAQSAMLLIARVYYAAGNTVKPLLFGLTDVVISVVSAVVFLQIFQHSEFFRMFIESILRVGDVPGSIVLMLALGYALGSIVEFLISFRFFMKDFSLPLKGLGRLVFEIFSASVIGSGVSYLLLAFFAKLVDINTTTGILTQGGVAGLGGLAMAGYILTILGNTEFAEAMSAVKRRFSPARTMLEPSDIASS